MPYACWEHCRARGFLCGAYRQLCSDDLSVSQSQSQSNAGGKKWLGHENSTTHSALLDVGHVVDSENRVVSLADLTVDELADGTWIDDRASVSASA